MGVCFPVKLLLWCFQDDIMSIGVDRYFIWLRADPVPINGFASPVLQTLQKEAKAPHRKASCSIRDFVPTTRRITNVQLSKRTAWRMRSESQTHSCFVDPDLIGLSFPIRRLRTTDSGDISEALEAHACCVLFSKYPPVCWIQTSDLHAFP